MCQLNCILVSFIFVCSRTIINDTLGGLWSVQGFVSTSNTPLHPTKRPRHATTERPPWLQEQEQKSINSLADDSNDDNESLFWNEIDDTIRVLLWRALASGEEMSLKQLGVMVGERRQGELRSHLTHVAKQAQTLRNKSPQWRERRGLDPNDNSPRAKKRQLVTRHTKKGIFVQLK